MNIEVLNIRNSISTLETKIDNMLNKVYPIGSIYLTVNSTNPGTFLGGTWQLFGEGRTLVCGKSSDTDFAKAKNVGGEKTHKLTINEIPSHTHTFTANSHTHTIKAHNHTINIETTKNGEHTHSLMATANPNSGGPGIRGTFNGQEGSGLSQYDTGGSTYGNGNHSHTISGNTGTLAQFNSGSYTVTGTNSNIGGSAVHNNMPPYIVCWIWERTS